MTKAAKTTATNPDTVNAAGFHPAIPRAVVSEVPVTPTAAIDNKIALRTRCRLPSGCVDAPKHRQRADVPCRRTELIAIVKMINSAAPTPRPASAVASAASSTAVASSHVITAAATADLQRGFTPNAPNDARNSVRLRRLSILLTAAAKNTTASNTRQPNPI